MPGIRGKQQAAALRLSEEDPAEIASKLDIQYNPEIINGLISDLQVQLEAKCGLIQKDIDFMSTSIKQAFHLELIKLPSQVKKMSLARFREEFGDSLEAVTRTAMSNKTSNKRGSSRNMPPPNVFQSAAKGTRSSSRFAHNSAVMQTPAGKSSSGFVAATPAGGTVVKRAPVEGEQLLSSNGSPLGEFQTAVKAPRQGGGLVPATPGTVVALRSGKQLNLEDMGDKEVQALSQEAKQDALEQMQAMMASMQSMMAKLGGGLPQAP